MWLRVHAGLLLWLWLMLRVRVRELGTHVPPQIGSVLRMGIALLVIERLSAANAAKTWARD
jgi:hypothetical protein